MRLLRRSSGDAGGQWIVAGLGNPGSRYETTRHNTGAMAIARLLEETGASLKRHKSGCLVAEVDLEGERVVLLRSPSYMNESGRPIATAVRWYKVPVERVIVVHDELDIPFGEVRVKVGGGTAGHNGLRSMAAHLGPDFIRVRVGIGRPRGGRDAVGYVLESFSASERKHLQELLGKAHDAVELILAHGPQRAMNDTNTRT